MDSKTLHNYVPLRYQSLWFNFFSLVDLPVIICLIIVSVLLLKLTAFLGPLLNLSISKK